MAFPSKLQELSKIRKHSMNKVSESSSSNNGATKILLLKKAFSPTWKLPWVSEGFFLHGGGCLGVGHRRTDLHLKAEVTSWEAGRKKTWEVEKQRLPQVFTTWQKNRIECLVAHTLYAIYELTQQLPFLLQIESKIAKKDGSICNTRLEQGKR